MSLDDWQGYPDSTFFEKNFIYVEEPYLAIEATSSTHNYYLGNRFIGPLSAPSNGFESGNTTYSRQLWYHASDTNWNRLIDFVKDKVIITGGQSRKVSEILGL